MPSLTLVSAGTSDFVRNHIRGLGVERGDAPLAIMDRLRRIVPFDGFAVSGLDVEDCRVGKGIFLAASYPTDLTGRYVREQWLRTDPLVQTLSEQAPSARWQDLDPVHFKGRQVETLLGALDDHDVGPRMVLTFWNRGRMYGSATFSRHKRFSDDEVADLTHFAPVVHDHLSRPIIAALNARTGLTRGEMICLKLGGEGLTAEQISDASDYSTETVTTYLKSATRKLGAANRTQAIAEAVRRKIIE